jgi:hypothetical protein
MQIPEGHPPLKDPPSAPKQPTSPRDRAPDQPASYAQLPKDLPSAPGPEGLPGSIPADVLQDSQLPPLPHPRAKELRDGPVSTPDLPEPKRARNEPAKPQEVEPKRARREPTRPQKMRPSGKGRSLLRPQKLSASCRLFQAKQLLTLPAKLLNGRERATQQRREVKVPLHGSQAHLENPVRSLHHPVPSLLQLPRWGSPQRCARHTRQDRPGDL